MKNHLRTMLWTPYVDPGQEYFSLYAIDEGFLFESAIAMSLDYDPLRVEYRILIDHDRVTQTVDVKVWQGALQNELHLRVDEEHRWWQGEKEIVECRGCIDIDLSLTPATNTLPIRRLALDDGESRVITVAWIQFPSLKIQPFRQRYTCLNAEEYLFESLEDDFKAELKVDEMGLVTDYIDGWQAITQLPR